MWKTITTPCQTLKSDWWMFTGRASELRLPPTPGVDSGCTTLYTRVQLGSARLGSTQLSGNTNFNGVHVPGDLFWNNFE
jgi:hypothetical protein